MKQYDLLRERIAQKASIILKKFKVKENSKEVSNQEISLLLCSYAIHNPIPESKLIELHSRLSKLTEFEMEIIRLFYWEGKTQDEIGEHYGKSRSWSQQALNKILDKLRTTETPTIEKI